MAVVSAGLNWKGEPCEYHIDDNLLKNLDEVKNVVNNKDFDFVAIVSGLPGQGKSNFAINLAKYCDPQFDKTHICFTAKEFIDYTSSCPKRSAVILDESFASLNNRVTQTKDFLRIINHLQIIRQRNLYIFLCLPNFFDLGKSISIMRSSWLFVVYGAAFGDRGSYACFDRDKKRELYVKGMKFMDYTCVAPNFRGRFVRQKAIDQEDYENMKLKHLKSGENVLEPRSKNIDMRDTIIRHAYFKWGKTSKELGEIANLSQRRVQEILGKESGKTTEKVGNVPA